MYGLAGKLARYFIDSKLTPILILVSLALGLFAVVTTPKEEEPQIVVPMIDIYISYPGATPEEVESRVVIPLEKKLWELRDIEYIYSASMNGGAVVTARFYVGTDPIKALVDLNSKMMSAMDLAPPGVVLPPLIKPMSIDDVPILTLTLWGEKYDWFALRRIAATLQNEIKKIGNVADVFILGGRPREVRVVLDPAKLDAYGVSPLRIAEILRSANAQAVGGRLKKENREFLIKVGGFLKSGEDVANLVVSAEGGRIVYLKDVARIIDGPSEVRDYVLMGFGVAREVLKLVEHAKQRLLPADLQITVTRNYGETAREKANELLKHLLIATFSVILLIAVALFLSEMYGFTLNRVTLFALIFAIGILVDDAIVVVENIHRWFEMRKLPPQDAIVRATDEVGNPTILATFTVIAALMPMAFVTGLMGPYMRPIPINASVAMFFSLLVAFVITPWAAYRFLKKEREHEELDIRKTFFWKAYCRLMEPLLSNRLKRYAFYTFVLLLLGGSLSLFYTKAVVVNSKLCSICRREQPSRKPSGLPGR